MKKNLLVIPTYNERENVRELIREIRSADLPVDILVVDDNSPDGTAAVVEELARSDSRLFLLKRLRKEGLGVAYVESFKWALAREYGVIGQMDADHSHRVVDLKRLLQRMSDGADFVVGSRWCPGGGIRNWSWLRRFLSRAGNLYARTMLGGEIYDWTGGFNVWRADVLQRIEMHSLESQGYAFQIELKYRAFKLKFSGFEVPIIFEERRLGQSKMSLRIIIEALLRVWKLKSKFNVS